MPKDLSFFRDYFQLVKPSDKDISKWKESMSDSVQDNLSTEAHMRQGLEVTLEATHAALFNDNLRFYLPSRMQDGCDTFVKRNKPAKILKHHDSTADPVGIIVGAEYISTIPDSIKDSKDVMILTDSSFSLRDQVKASRRLLKSNIPFTDEWRGLGYIQLKGIVYDQKTIEQIQDGRFDAVSTSFRSPGQAFCSECTQNLAQDGFCEHDPGSRYSDGDEDESGVICGIIPGIYNYDEISFVVFDGDPLTQVSIGHQDSIKEYKISMDNWKETSKEKSNNIEYSFRDFKEETNMADNKADENKASDATSEEDVTAADQGTQEINSDSICDEMQVELKAMLDEKLITQEEWEIANSKLSAEQRKKLSDATFCGPERSFPVPDCAHVTAARRLIDRYEGPGDKKEIIAHIDRKAKALGYNTKEDKVVIEEPQADKFEVPTCDNVTSISDDETKQLFNVAEAEMIKRNLKLERPCGKCAAHENDAQKHKEALEGAEVTIKDLNDTLTVLREELRYQIADYMAQVDRYVELGASLTAAQKDHLALVGTLTGRFENVENAMDSLNSIDIVEQTPVIMADFKIEDVVSKINSGMSREPVEDIKDPVNNTDIDNHQLPDGLSIPAIRAIEQIRDFVKNNDIVNANNFYVKMVGLRVIDEKIIPFNSLSAKKQEVAE